MKSRRLTRIIAMTLFAVAGPVGVAAQQSAIENHGGQHHHYKLVDLGTLGGPQSVIYEQVTRPLNNQGTVVYCADTANFDPDNPQNPYFLYPDSVVDPYIQHVSQWRDGRKTDLGALPGGTSSCTQWINERGMVVGGSANGVIDALTGYPEVVATLWQDGEIYNLGTLGGNESAAYALNDLGRVVGWASNTIPDPYAYAVFADGATQAHATLWRNGTIQDLGTLGGPDSAAYFVNEHGQIAGQALTNSIPNVTTGFPTQDPFLWERGGMIDLGTLGGTNGYPLSLNNRGQVVGQSNLAGDQTFNAFLWERGVLKDLGTLGGQFSSAYQINDAGEVAGYSTLSGDQVFHPFLLKNGHMFDLGVVAGEPCGYAIGISSAGQVVGASYDCNLSGYHAFLWENGSIVDLNDLIPPGSDLYLGAADSMNDLGEIAAVGRLSNGDARAFLLIPCDEHHPGVEGCDYALVDATAEPQSPAPRYFPSATQRAPQSRRTNR
jgi:probable HAF family extracellular repeat protein